MSTTRDYLEYLNQKIDIAPVNSEEEYQAAGLIESLMQSHGLETRVQEFKAVGLGRLLYQIIGILLFLGVFLAGLLQTQAQRVGIVVIVVSFVILALDYMGIASPLNKFGRNIHSQNVIGIHQATGPLVEKGVRPIVIIAHYDTPRENFLYSGSLVKWQSFFLRSSPICTFIASILGISQVIYVLPEGIRHLLWVVGIIVSLPIMICGVAAVQERFAACTMGTNDNKSGVAAMLGIMNMVSPSDDEATGYDELRIKRELEAKERAKAEAARIAAEKAAEEEAARIAAEKAAEEEAARIAAEKAAEEEAAQQKEAEEAIRIAAEKAAAQQVAMQEAARKKAADEAAKIHAEAMVRAEAEAKARNQAEEQARIQAEAKKRAIDEEEARVRIEQQAKIPEQPADQLEIPEQPAESLEIQEQPAEQLEVEVAPSDEQTVEESAVSVESYDASTVEEGSDQIPQEEQDMIADVEVEYIEETEQAEISEQVGPDIKEAESKEEPDQQVEAVERQIVKTFEIMLPVPEILDAEFEILEDGNSEEKTPFAMEQAETQQDQQQTSEETESITDIEPDDSGQRLSVQADYEVPASIVPKQLTRSVIELERIYGIRHGKEILESLHILPQDCEIVYDEPRRQVHTWVEEEHDETATYGIGQLADNESYKQSFGEDKEDKKRRKLKSTLKARLFSNNKAHKKLFGRTRDSWDSYRERRRIRHEEKLAQKAAVAAEKERERQNNNTAVSTVDLTTGEELLAEKKTQENLPLADRETTESAHEVKSETAGQSAATLSQDEQPKQTTTLDTNKAVEEDSRPSLYNKNVDGTLPFVPLGQLIDGQEVDEQGAQKDSSGLDELVTDDAFIRSQKSSVRNKPKAPDDPEWGKSNFKPETSNIAYRAILYDVPNPLNDQSDMPFGVDGTSPVTHDSTQQAQGSMSPIDYMSSGPEPLQILKGASTVNDTSDKENKKRKKKKEKKRHHIFSRKKAEVEDTQENSISSWLGVNEDYDAKKEGQSIGSWEHFGDDENKTPPNNKPWKGGATYRSDLRVEQNEDDVRVQEDLRETVLAMEDDALVAHDIWFVALGGSFIDHAGIKAFLAENRRFVRGSFVMNLTCVGAGNLSVLTSEGLIGTRKVDRRMKSLLKKVSADLHIDINYAAHNWETTDATPAMKMYMRAMTICGLTPEGVFALSKVPDDDPSLVDAAQTSAVADLIAEMIRRS